ncbi:S8 family serine peptidase, partial [Halorubrum pallidum]
MSYRPYPDAVLRSTRQLVLYSAETSNQLVEAANDINSRDDIDAVSMSLGFDLGTEMPLDGTDEVSQAISQSANNGTVWSISAGNSGTGNTYYSAKYDNSQFDDRHTFGSQETPADLTRVNSRNAGEVWGALRWNEWSSTSNAFTVSLYEDANDNGTYTQVLDSNGDPQTESYTSVDEPSPYFTFRFIEGVDSNEDYALAVFNQNTGSNPDVRLGIALNRGEFTEHPTRKYTITPPATDAEPLTVGAADAKDARDSKQLRPYSSRGPTVDGRSGVDVVGPDGVEVEPYPGTQGFTGTSAAAPHVAGVAGLVQADLETTSTPDPTTANITSRIVDNTFGMPGATNEVGSGHLDARQATVPQTVTQGAGPTYINSQNEDSVSVSTDLRAPPAPGTTVVFDASHTETDETVTTTVPGSVDTTTYTGTLDFSGVSDGSYNLTSYVLDSSDVASPETSVLDGLTADTVRPTETVTNGDTGTLNASTADSVPVQLRFNEAMNTSTTPEIRVEGLNQTYTGTPAGGWVNATAYEGQYSLPDGLEGTATINATGATDVAGNPTQATDSETVTVDTKPPSVVGLDAEIGLRETNVTITTDEQADDATLTVDGPDSGTLTLSENLSSPTEQNGNYTYEATYSTENGGDYNVSVTTLADAAGNDAETGQSAQTFIAEEDKGTLTGTISEQDTDDPLTNVSVELTPSDQAEPTPQAATVYENGTYEIRTATGQYDVSATHDEGDYKPNTTTGTIDLAVTNTSDLTLEAKPASLSGSVTPADGTNVSFEGTTVDVTDESDTTVATPTLDANNEFTVSEIEPGAYTVTADPTDYATVTQEINPGPNESVTLSTQAETLPAEATGSVNDTTRNTSATAATIEAVDNQTETVEATAEVDASGNYALTFGPGNYTLRAVGPFYESNETSVTTTSNGAVTAGFELERVPEYVRAGSLSTASSAEVGDDVTLETTVTSLGATSANDTITFTAGGSEVGTADVTDLAPGQSETMSTTYTVPESAANSTISITAETADTTTSAREVDIAALPDESSNPGSSGGGGGGGGGGG